MFDAARSRAGRHLIWRWHDARDPSLTHVTIHTDGACSGNPGVGGYGAILEAAGQRRELSGGVGQTTNNRMEMTAVIRALAELKRPCAVDVYSDSAYVINAFNDGWLERWQRNGWRNAAGQDVSNRDLWEELLELARPHRIRWHKVAGHADNELNNRADELAVAAARAWRDEHGEGR